MLFYFSLTIIKHITKIIIFNKNFRFNSQRTFRRIENEAIENKSRI